VVSEEVTEGICSIRTSKTRKVSDFKTIRTHTNEGELISQDLKINILL
jgi:hypothetical protein